MGRTKLAHFVLLSRAGSSFSAALTIFLPTLFWEASVAESLRASAPILTSAMSGFILNDIFDSERDLVNHPERPIPNGDISKSLAMGIYFGLLAASLVMIKAWVPGDRVFYYLIFLLFLSNYNFIVEKFPAFKNLYVGLAASVPVYIATSLLSDSLSQILIPGSMIIFFSGREMLMDVADRDGDGLTLANLIGVSNSINLSFLLQLIASLSLFLIANSTIEKVAGTLITMLVCLFFWLLHVTQKTRLVVQLMKIQFLIGLVFLLP